MHIKEFIRVKYILSITMVSMFFLFVSNLAFAMHEDEDKIEVRISPIVPHSSNVSVENSELSSSVIKTDEEIDIRPSQISPHFSNILAEGIETPSLIIEADEEIEVIISPILPPLSSEILVENNETSTPAIGADEEIKLRLAQAISERYDEYIEKSPPQFSLRELPPIVGIVSGLPYSEFAIQEAGDSLFLKVYFTGSTLASVGLSRVWALDALFNEVWRDSKQKKITHLSVNILSLLSALPLTYAVWDDGHSILDTCIIFMSEWSIATLGFYEIFNKVSDQYSSLNRNGETATNQQLPSLENLNLPVRQFFRHLLSQPNPDVFAEEVCSSLEEEHVPNAPSMVRHVELAEIPKSTPKALTKGLFYIIPGASLIVNSVLAYQSIEAFTSSPFIIVPYMALTTLPTFALQLYTTSSSVDDLW